MPSPRHGSPQARWFREAIALGNQLHFRKQSAWRHNSVNVALALCLVGLTACALGLGSRLPTLAYVLVGGASLGSCFFALIILVVHEASHGMFVVSRHRARARFWNRAAGWLVSVPFSINYLRHWEEGHLVHHEQPMEPGDPQTENICTGRALVSMVLRMLLIPGYVFLWNPSRKYRTQRWLPFASGLFWLLLVTACVRSCGWASAGSLLFGLQVLGALNQVKGALEHGGDIAREPNRNLRSRTSLFPLRWLLMPFNISLHFEHHLNQCVPWYALLRYHQALRKVVPQAVQAELFNDGIVEQLMGRRGGLSPLARQQATEA
ncbi:MAG: fatty acid desaturase [Polyangiaceae bacterium]